jgi:hypothetical protein
MPWENTRIFQTMFVGENNLERKIWNAYVEDCLVQSYFNDLSLKKKVKRITFLNGLLKWKQSRVYVLEGKLHTNMMHP